MNNPFFHTTPQIAYSIALQDLRTSYPYFYFQHILNNLEIIEQCYSYISIIEENIRQYRSHHPSSYILNINLAKKDLIYQKVFSRKSNLE